MGPEAPLIAKASRETPPGSLQSGPAVESTASLGVSRRALLARLATQPASGEARSWQRDDLYD